LFALFKASDEDSLKRNPLDALFRGDLRYADRFGDYISDDYFNASRAAATSDLAALQAIDRGLLSPTDQIAYDTFAFTTKDAIAHFEPSLLALSVVRPINHFSGLQTFYPTLSSGKGVAPFATLADYDNALKRHDGYVAYLDAAVGRFREGRAAGVVDTKLTIRNVIEQLDTQLAQKPEDSAFYGPIKHFPAAIGAAVAFAVAHRKRVVEEHLGNDARTAEAPAQPPLCRSAGRRLRSCRKRVLKARTAAAGPSGCCQTPALTARKSAPASTRGDALATVMPPMATHGTVIRLLHHARISGSACDGGFLVAVAKKAPKAT